MRSSTTLLSLALLLAACDAGSSLPTEASAALPAAARGVSADLRTPELLRNLARARAATGRFHSFANADAAEYDFLFMDMCMDDPAGGMGYHYVNVGLLDGVVEIEHPEAVMYEPMPNGRLRLVGLEYVIPKDAWEGEGLPTLFGQPLELNSFDLYALHVWLWKDNPEGIFEPWNPTVSCANAITTAAAGSHH
jgi:hypothetical protein